uniref:Interleukin-4/13b1 n=1 Tax=Oncorhynchus mykiss TaxID=8022 RepID=A0A0P0ZFR2_ONCMY|nr:interleukin-4/13b1 precursor [Oncorhynchus mykiss]
MKTLALLFSFAFVLVFTAPTKTPDEIHLLQRIMKEANKTLKEGPEALLNHLVPAEFKQDRCKSHGPKDFCIAETILSNINKTQYGTSDNNIETISRVLEQYNKLHPSNCTMKTNGDEEQLRGLLMNLYNCAQAIYSRPHPVTHHKTTPAL